MYLAMKTLHVLAVVLFLGNIITGIFWKVHGDRTADPRIIAHTLEGIIRSDRWFTIPGVVLILGFGVGAAVIGGLPILGTGWIWQSIALFAVWDWPSCCRSRPYSAASTRWPRLEWAAGPGMRWRTADSRAGGNSGEAWPL